MEVRHQLIQRASLSMTSANPPHQSVLMLAAMHGNVSLVSQLLTARPTPDQVNQRDDEGSTALMAAAENNHIAVARLLLAHAEIDAHLKDNVGHISRITNMRLIQTRPAHPHDPWGWSLVLVF